MPIKAKRIDPSRARLAARGQWHQQPQPQPQPPLGAGTGRSSRASSSTSSEDSPRRRVGRQGCRAEEKPKSPGPPAFLTATDDVEDEDSDPELYRAARERTARFLYPYGHQVSVASPNYSGDKAPSNKTRSEASRGGTGVPSNSSKEEKYEGYIEGISIDMADKDATPQKESASARGDLGRETRHHIDDAATLSPSKEDATHWGYPAPPTAVREALEPVVEAEDFRRLLELLADDVAKAREPKGPVEPAQSQEELPRERQKEEDMYKKENESEATAPTYGYARPARNFAELQEQELLRLYAAASETQPYFIATDHTAEAFTFAAMTAEQRSRHVDPVEHPPVPLSIVALDAAERVRRNACATMQERQRLASDNEQVVAKDFSDALLSANASILAANAEQSLQRFFSCVHWIEVAMRNRRFVDEVGRFFYDRHRLFLRPSAGESGGAREFSHEAFAAYEEFSRSVSEYVTAVLRYRVPGFSAEEFVLALYDTPLSDSSVAEDEEKNANSSPQPLSTMAVLSFHAWRVMQAILSFEQFCAIMDEFIAEEYGMDEGGDGTLEGGGRGVVSFRALLTKSRQRRTQEQGQELTHLVHDEALQSPDPPMTSSASPAMNAWVSRESSLAVSNSPPRSGVAPSLLQSRPVVSQTPPPPPQAQLFASQHSSRSSVASFPRRPDAVPGRTLPPLKKNSSVSPQRRPLRNAKEPVRDKKRSAKPTGVEGTSNEKGLKLKEQEKSKVKRR